MALDPQDPQLRAALQESRRATRQATAQISALTATIKRDHSQFKQDAERRRAEREARNRSGENGADAQRMQERIDTRQTTWEDILSGDDDTANGVRVRQTIAQGVAHLRSIVDNDEDFEEARADVDRHDAEIRAAIRGEDA